MNKEEQKEIQERIKSLPKGNISIKTINGRKYEYWQFREDGKQISRRVKGIELEALRGQIEERKRLESMLKKEKNGIVENIEKYLMSDEGYHGQVRTGKELKAFAMTVKGLKRRGCFSALTEYIYGDGADRVLILFGLRRTGKTTLIKQVILEMDPEIRSEAVFIQVIPGETLAELNSDLRLLEKSGYRYVFIDEVTLLDDFIEGAAVFSDIFAASGMKIVLSGTDSLGFLFSEDEQLYDRCYMQHTTFIPYREFETVLGIKGIDEYIRYGGTMSMGGKDYNRRNMTFATTANTNEYIDSAIARNIQHSLRNYQYGGHFRDLQELYDAGELTNAINRIVEDMGHRFTREVIQRAFKSHDLGISRNNLRSDRGNTENVLDDIDTVSVTENLMRLLDIQDNDKRKIDIREEHVREIQEYLELLDLIEYVQVINAANVNSSKKRTIITQPGLRYSQAEALITSLLQDEVFRNLGVKKRLRISERIMSEIKGRMMEDIILLETRMANPDKEVFVLKFAVGEFDMVVYDPAKVSCRIYEIKHSQEVTAAQYRHLKDPGKCSETEKQYGTIEGRFVIYRGPAKKIDGIQYLNAEEYLMDL